MKESCNHVQLTLLLEMYMTLTWYSMNFEKSINATFIEIGPVVFQVKPDDTIKCTSLYNGMNL
jgi:hypothetical protein